MNKKLFLSKRRSVMSLVITAVMAFCMLIGTASTALANDTTTDMADLEATGFRIIKSKISSDNYTVESITDGIKRVKTLSTNAQTHGIVFNSVPEGSSNDGEKVVLVFKDAAKDSVGNSYDLRFTAEVLESYSNYDHSSIPNDIWDAEVTALNTKYADDDDLVPFTRARVKTQKNMFIHINDDSHNIYMDAAGFESQEWEYNVGIRAKITFEILGIPGTSTSAPYRMMFGARDVDQPAKISGLGYPWGYYPDDNIESIPDGARFVESVSKIVGKIGDEPIYKTDLMRQNATGTEFWGSTNTPHGNDSLIRYIANARKTGFTWTGSACSSALIPYFEDYKVTEKIEEGEGTVSNEGKYSVAWHQIVKSKVVPAKGWRIKKVEVGNYDKDEKTYFWDPIITDGKINDTDRFSGSVESGGTVVIADDIFLLEEDRIMRVWFEEVPKWKIETEVVNGTIDPDITEIPTGENRTVHYSPDPGYLLSEIIVDGTPLPDPMTRESSYPFEKINSDHKIKVVYEKQSDPVKTVKNEAGADINNKYVDDGATLFYEIDVKNPTKIPQTYTITDNVPANTKFKSATEGGKESGGVVSWTLTVPGGQTGKVKWQATTVGKGKTINNKATMKIKNISLDTNTVTNWTPEDPTKDVQMNGTSINRDVRLAGNILTYKIDLKNIANVTKTFHVEDPIIDGLSFVSASDGGTNDNGIVKWDVALTQGQEKSITWEAKVEESAKDTILINNAKYTVDEAVKPEVQDKPKTPIFKDPVKEVTREIDGVRTDINQKLVNVNSQLDYTITWHNPADEQKTFIVTDKAPEHTTLIKDSVSEGGIVDESGNITWEVTLGAKENGSVSFSVMTSEAKNVHIPNTANVSVRNTGGDVNLDTNEVENWIPPQPDKLVFDEKGNEIEFGILKPGDSRRVRYQLSFTNNSTLEKEFLVKDPLPKGILQVEILDDGVYDEETNTISWVRTMAPGETQVVSFYADIDPSISSTEDGVSDNYVYTYSDLWDDNERERLHIEDEDIRIRIPVEKVWNDDNNAEGNRPIAIDITLMQEDGKTVGDLTLSDLNGWKGEFSNIRKIVNGSVMRYIVKEKPVSGYSSVVTGSQEEGFVITNTPGTDTGGKDVLNDAGISINGKAVEVGQEIEYVLTYKNTYMTPIVLEAIDPIPEGVEVVSVENDGIYREDKGEIYWKVFPVASGDTVTLKWKAKVLPSAEGTLTNTIETRNDKDPVYKPTNTTTNIIEDPPVKKVLDAAGNDINGQQVTVGDILTYEVSWKNASETEKEYTVEDALPSGTEFISAENDGTFADGKISWKVKVPAEQNAAVRFKVRVTSSAFNPIKNVATVTKDGNARKTNEVENPVKDRPTPDQDIILGKQVTVYKTSEPAPNSRVEAGDEIKYILKAKNTGEAVSGYTRIRDYIPAMTTYVDGSVSSGGVYIPANEIHGAFVEWIISGIEPNAEYAGDLSFKVSVNESAKDQIRNIALFDTHESDPGEPGSQEKDPGLQTDPVLHTLDEDPTDPVIEVIKSSDPTPGTRVKEGDVITYSLLVKNSGGSEAKSVVIRDAIPNGTTYVKDSADNGAIQKGNDLQWTLPSLASGDELTLTFKVSVNKDDVTLVQNQARYDMDFDPESEEDPKNTSNIVEHPKTPHQPDTGIILGDEVTVYKHSDPEPNTVVEPGQTINYWFTAKNTGKDTSGFTVIRDYIPEGTTYVEGSVSDNGTYVDAEKPYVEFIISGIEPDKEYKGDISFAVTVNEDHEGLIENFGKFETTEKDPGTPGTITKEPELPTNPIFHTTDEEVYPTPAVIEVIKHSDPAPGKKVGAGDVITYTLTVKNTGGSAAKSVVVRDTIPGGTVYVDGSANGTFENGMLQWFLEELGANEEAELTFQVKADGSTNNIRNQAVYDKDFDPASKNTPKNTSNIVEHPLAKEAKDPVKSVRNASGADINGKEVAVGDSLYYYIHFENPLDTEQEFTIKDEVPKGTEFVMANSNGVNEKGTVTWKVAVPAGESYDVMMQVKVTDATVKKIDNIAKVTDASGKEKKTNKVSNTPKETVTPTPTPTVTPTISKDAKTGDISILPLMIAGLAAIAGVSALLIVKRKKNV